jgi:hypothetical protein
MGTLDWRSLSTDLPVTSDLTLAYVLTLGIAFVMVVASIAGVVYPNVIYPTDELLRSFVANDVVNLFLGLPILLGSMWLARRGRLIGLLFWPGALFYVLYNYIVYVFGMPFNVVFPLYLTLVASSAYTMIGLVASIDGNALQRRLGGAVPERICGGVLIGLSALFFLRVVGIMGNALISRTPVAETELALLISDFITSPASAIGGILLWRRKPLGYVTGTGLLFQASMLFIGLIAVLFLQPLLTDAPFPLTDIVVTLILGLICFVPLALFLRGVLSKGEQSADQYR